MSQQANQPLDPAFVSDPTLLYRFLKGWKFDVPTTVERVNQSQQYRAEHGLTEIRAKAATLEQRQFPYAEQILKYWPHVIHARSTTDRASRCPSSDSATPTPCCCARQ